MKRESLLIVAALLIFGLAAFFWFQQGERAAPPEEPGTTNLVESVGAPDPVLPSAEASEITRSEIASSPSGVIKDRVVDERLSDPDIVAALTGFTGRLIDAQGKAMPDRTMQIWRGDLASLGGTVAGDVPIDLEGPDRELQLIAGQAKTGTDGRFLITGIWPRAVYMTVADAGGDNPTFMLVERSPDPGQTVDLGDIKLKDCATLTGKVVDEDGKPIADALVRATDLPGLALKYLPLERFDPAGAVVDREVSQAGATAALFEVPLWAQHTFNQLPIPKTRTAADGTFRLTGVDPADVLVAFTANGFVAQVNPRVRLKTSQEHDLGTVRLSRGESLIARVVDGNGQPVVGAQTMAGQTSLAVPVDFVSNGPLTDDEGEFEMTGFTGKVTVAARRDAKSPWVIAESRHVTDDVVLTLPARCTLTVQVQDQGGAPVKDPKILLFHGAGVEAESLYSMSFYGFTKPIDVKTSMTTDQDGRQIIKELDAGPYVLAVQGEGFTNEVVVVDLTKDIETIVKVTPTVPLTVRVVDGRQQPVRNAAIAGVAVVARETSVSKFCGLTDASGVLVAEGFAEGPVRFTASHPKYGKASGALELGSRELTIRMQTPGAIDGVLTEAGAVPTPGKWVVVISRDWWEDEASSISMPRFATPSADGKFKVEGLQPGNYTAVAIESLRFIQSPGKIYSAASTFWLRSSGEAESVVVAPGERAAFHLDAGLDAVEVTGPAARVTGLVTLNGRPASEYMVVVFAERRHLATTTELGRFDLGRLPAGPHTLQILYPTSAGVDQREAWGGSFVVVADQDQDQQIDVKTGKLTGTIQTAEGARAGGCAVRVTGHLKGLSEDAKGSFVYLQTVSDSNGCFELPLVTEGTYTVVVEQKGHGKQQRKDVLVEQASVVDLELSLVRGYRMTGRLDMSVLGIQGGTLTLTRRGSDEEHEPAWASYGTDGSFQFDDLVPGEYDVSIWVPSSIKDNEHSYLEYTVQGAPLRVGHADSLDLQLRPVQRMHVHEEKR